MPAEPKPAGSPAFSYPLPNHVAIIMDGNRRWAKERGLPRYEGHRAGVANLKKVVRQLAGYGIPYLTVYGFSTENWKRDKSELSDLFGILEEGIKRETGELHKSGVKIRHLGRLESLSQKLQKDIKEAVRLTENNTGITLSVAFNYGSRSEIIDAVREILAKGTKPEGVDEASFARYLYTSGLPDVDLLIRTGGEFRTSNFMMWQSAYAELYFTGVLWPDFNGEEVEKALKAFGQRQRRFGGR